MPITLNYTGTRITDAIAGVLTGADLTAYNAAPTNALVPISRAGYLAIAAMSGATKAGLTDAALSANILPGLTGGNTGWQNSVGSVTNSLYTAGYVVAFRIIGDSNFAAQAGMQLGYATTAAGTGVAISSASTATATFDTTYSGSLGSIYYVVKSPNVLVPAGSLPRVFLSLIASGRVYAYSSAAISNASNYAGTSITSTYPSPFNNYIAMQMVQLPTKQW